MVWAKSANMYFAHTTYAKNFDEELIEVTFDEDRGVGENHLCYISLLLNYSMNFG